MSRKHSHFTLVEVLVVIIIIGIVGSVFAVGIFSALRTERYRASADLMVSKLQLAQDIMLHTDLDISLVIFEETAGISCSLLLDSGVVPQELRASIGKVTPLSGIRDIALTSSEGLPLTLEFFSRGGKMTAGVLSLVSRSDETSYITLPGFPTNYQQKSAPDEERFEREYDVLYPKEIL